MWQFVASRAALSRLFVCCLVFISSNIISPYDSSNVQHYSWERWFVGFANWDGVYFKRISEAGYEFEQYFAFFPLFPCLIKACSACIAWPLAIMGIFPETSAVHLISGICISNTAFVLASVALYQLSVRVR